MSYRTISVCLDSTDRSDERQRFAIELARQFDAHLSGLHFSYEPFVPYAPEAGIDTSGLLAEVYAEIDRERQSAETAFRQQAQQAGLNADWRGFYLREMNQAVAQARASDLIVLGQQERGEEQLHVAEHHASRFLMGTGRPVLMLPNVGSVENPRFDTVMVAWNGSREAARALSDALPLLKQAKSVRVFSVESPSIYERAYSELPDVDIAAYLSRHGVKAEIVRQAVDDQDIGEWLLSRATDLNADLLVMGAYGHSRLGEMVLGGVTRTILRDAFLPVLISH